MSRRGLPFELFLGLRYLRARGHRTNLSLFVWIGVGGVFLGVSALIVVLAVMTGFQDGIRDRIIAANPHILIFEGGGRGMRDAPALLERVRDVPGVRSVAPFVMQQALFTVSGGGATGGLVRGVDIASESVRKDLTRQIKMGSLEPLGRSGGEPAIILGRELARTLGVIPGESVTVISPQGALTAVGMVPKMRRFTVAGTFEVGMYEYDSSLAYVSLGVAQEFAGLGDRVTGIEVKLRDPFEAKTVARAITQRLGFPYLLRDWMEMNRNLFNALQLEKLALFIIVTIIVLVAAFAIIGHLILLVAEKRKEIGILKAMGAPAGSVGAVFLSVGMLIGLVGTAAGSAVGLGLIWVQNTYRIIRLAGDVYQIDYLPMKLTWSDFGLIIGATLLISFAFTLLPARRAARLDPVEVLRYE
ncbi:MAG: Lipoprotein releasing system, transmembrane protein, LolC/E family [Candidatus Rokubacteria bacterium CSP1-6]|nr:MAG: Lipoprotein releasing system, transmembrane protein, LolC/E family [Candidatus Rokubacteria bacterium CSP1-6]